MVERSENSIIILDLDGDSTSFFCFSIGLKTPTRNKQKQKAEKLVKSRLVKYVCFGQIEDVRCLICFNCFLDIRDI